MGQGRPWPIDGQVLMCFLEIMLLENQDPKMARMVGAQLSPHFGHKFLLLLGWKCELNLFSPTLARSFVWMWSAWPLAAAMTYQRAAHARWPL